MNLENQLYTVVAEEEVEVSTLTPHPYNSQYVGADNMRADPQLVADIAEHGTLRKPCVMRTDGIVYILAGHRRIDAAKQLGIKRIVVEIVQPREGVEVKDIIISDNDSRERTERMRNVEACRLISILGQSAKLRKVKNLKSTFSAIDEDDEAESGSTADVVSSKLGESERTIKSRKFVHYEPVMTAFLEDGIGIPKAWSREGAEALITECRTRWLAIREANNSEEISISRAAEMVRALQEEFQRRAGGKKAKKTKPAAAKKAKVETENEDDEPNAKEVKLSFANRPNGLVWIHSQPGYKYGLILNRDNVFVPAAEKDSGEIIVVDWERVLQPALL